jgi:hypothetical protein
MCVHDATHSHGDAGIMRRIMRRTLGCRDNATHNATHSCMMRRTHNATHNATQLIMRRRHNATQGIMRRIMRRRDNATQSDQGLCSRCPSLSLAAPACLSPCCCVRCVICRSYNARMLRVQPSRPRNAVRRKLSSHQFLHRRSLWYHLQPSLPPTRSLRALHTSPCHHSSPHRSLPLSSARNRRRIFPCHIRYLCHLLLCIFMCNHLQLQPVQWPLPLILHPLPPSPCTSL